MTPSKFFFEQLAHFQSNAIEYKVTADNYLACIKEPVEGTTKEELERLLDFYKDALEAHYFHLRSAALLEMQIDEMSKAA